MNRFNFTGKAGLFPDSSDKSSFKEGVSKNGDPYIRLNMSVSSNKNNRGYCELFGMVQDKILTMGKDKERIEIPWEDRNDKDVISKVADFRKRIISLDGDRYEFISDYDFINFIKTNLTKLNNSIVTITGQVRKSLYNGNITDHFEISNIYESDESAKQRLRVVSDVFFTKDSIDTDDWKSEKKLNIKGYVEEYIDKNTGVKFIEQPIVFDCSNIDFENDKHRRQVILRLKQIGLELDDNNNIKNKLKGKYVYKIKTILTYYNGAEEVDFDEGQLTPNQREYIELGLKTIDDFKPAGSIYGNRIKLYKLSDFDIKGDYSDGYITAVTNDGDDLTVEMLEKNLFVEATEESFSDVKSESKAKKEIEEKIEEDVDDLFD